MLNSSHSNSTIESVLINLKYIVTVRLDPCNNYKKKYEDLNWSQRQ